LKTTIQWAYTGMEGNFRKYDASQVQLLGTPYDISKAIIIKYYTAPVHHFTYNSYKFYHLILESIMHYGWYYFAKDTSKPTITDKSGNKILPSDDFTSVLYNTYNT